MEPEPRRGRRGEAILLVAAAIWGLAFTAQKEGANHVGPLLFNGLRFALGCLPLVPFLLRRTGPERVQTLALPARLWRGAALGAVLALGAWLQQWGLALTSAGAAGFITGLYLVLVPVLGLAMGQQPGPVTWLGVGSAAVGLYLLSVEPGQGMAWGDGLLFASAVVWTFHVQMVYTLARQIHWAELACVQFATCSALSLLLAAALEEVAATPVRAALWPLLYTGLVSVGIGLTLQIVGQGRASATGAAVAMSLEAVFAAVFGRLLLGERMTGRELAGCALMLAGMVLAQRVRAPAGASGRRPDPEGPRAGESPPAAAAA